MKNIAFLISGIFLFFSCSNGETSEKKSDNSKKEEVEIIKTDSLPDAEWNGEYMQIRDEDELKSKRKSMGSDVYSMGKIKLTIGDDLVDFTLFERQKNVLTFTNGSITAFIKSAFGEDLHLKFTKKDIVVNHKGKYKADPSEKANNSFSMSIKSGEEDQTKKYSIQDGEAEIISFSPRLGTLEVKIKGTFIDDKGTKQKGDGMIKMNFENAIMTAI